MYKQYNSKGFEIIGLSVDADALEWKKAIEEDKIDLWKHGLIVKEESDSRYDGFNSIFNKYFVVSYPTKVLINKEGNIIARWRGGGEENFKSLKQKLEELFADN